MSGTGASEPALRTGSPTTWSIRRLRPDAKRSPSNLRLDNMTRACKAKQGHDGSYLPNGQAAKSGLNRSLLGRGLGQIKTFVEYRCRRVGMIFIQVDPAGTSIECPQCHHRDKRNRLSQSDFECARCRHTEHADVIGGVNIRDRAFQKITEISPGTSLKNARPLKSPRKGQPARARYEPRNTSKTSRSRWVDYLTPVAWAARV